MKVKSGLSRNGRQETKAEKAIRSFEERVRDDDLEHMVVMDRDGNIIAESVGEADSVDVGLSDDQIKDMITSHNHPDWVLEDGTKIVNGVFSPDDITSMAMSDEYESRVVTSLRTYILRRKDFNDSSGRKPFARAYEAFWEKAEAHAIAVTNKAIADGKIKDTESAFDRCANMLINKYLRKWLRNNAGKYGYEYEERLRRKHY